MADTKSPVDLSPSTGAFNHDDEKWRGNTESVATSLQTTSLSDEDEAFAFLETDPRAAELRAEGQAILDDPVRCKKLLRKIDFNIVLLLGAVYAVHFLDKVTLEVSAPV